MAAGGFKTFTAGAVLSAADVNNYLMQGILVFGGTAARSSAIPSPVHGQMTFRTDDDVLEYYDGAAWAAVSGGASRPASISYLVIGGGGAGGANSDGTETGGGGSGQYIAGTAAPASGTTYTITVGAGAAGSIFANPFNGVGIPSSAFSQTAAGGGRGRSVVNGPVWQEATVNGGGNSRGGGGASNYPSASSNANGSAGTSSSITLSAVTRAGGGGGYNGGTGGAGGGGAYGNNAGTVNTGSGGGSGVNYGGAGGSGCVIVSQLAADALPTVLTGTPYTYSNGTNIVFFFFGSGSIGWA